MHAANDKMQRIDECKKKIMCSNIKLMNSKFSSDKNRIWDALVLCLFLLIPICITLSAFADTDTRKTPSYTIMAISASVICGWLIIIQLVSLYHARWLARVVTIEKDEVSIECFYSRTFNLGKEDLSAVQVLPGSFYYRHMTFMSRDKKNYLLTTASGEKFYLSGLIEDVDTLINELDTLLGLSCEGDNKFNIAVHENESWDNLALHVNYFVILSVIVLLSAFFYILPEFLQCALTGHLGRFFGSVAGDVLFACASVYALVRFLSSLIGVRRFVKKLEIHEPLIRIQTKFFKRHEFGVDDIESVELVTWRWYFAHLTFLRATDDNYVLKTKSGCEFYLSAESATIDDLIERLNGLTSKNSDQDTYGD